MKAEYCQHQAISVMPTSWVIKIRMHDFRKALWILYTWEYYDSCNVPITRGQHFVNITKVGRSSLSIIIKRHNRSTDQGLSCSLPVKSLINIRHFHRICSITNWPDAGSTSWPVDTMCNNTGPWIKEGHHTMQ